MKKYFFFIILLISISFTAQDHRIPVDTTVVTTNSVKIKGKIVPYKATTGMQPVWNSNGKICSLTLLHLLHKNRYKKQRKKDL